MREVKLEIAKEALNQLAGHYNTTSDKVASAIKAGNTKLFNELNDLCEKALALIVAEVA